MMEITFATQAGILTSIEGESFEKIIEVADKQLMEGHYWLYQESDAPPFILVTIPPASFPEAEHLSTKTDEEYELRYDHPVLERVDICISEASTMTQECMPGLDDTFIEEATLYIEHGEGKMASHRVIVGARSWPEAFLLSQIVSRGLTIALRWLNENEEAPEGEYRGGWHVSGDMPSC